MIQTQTALPQNKRTVAVVDSNTPHREQVMGALMSFYDTDAHETSADALRKLNRTPPAVIVVGEDIKPMGSIEFIRAVRALDALKTVPILYVAHGDDETLAHVARDAGASGHLARPYRRSMLIHALSQQLNAGIEHEWEALPEIQRAALKNSVGVFHNIADVLGSGEVMPFATVKDAVQPLVSAIENNDFKSILDGVRNHDDYTYAHSMRVATMLSLLGHAAGFKNDEQLLLASGGLLHDVGKMKIPHSILNKPGRLDEAEFELMKSHVPETMKYLTATGGIPHAVMIIAEQHHEKLNGLGYPNGLKGGQLNELARMAAIVDVFSALTDRRVYKPPMESTDALDLMTGQMGDHLDQHFVKLFKTILNDAKVL